MQDHDRDDSEEEAGLGGSSSAQNTKRTAKACDRCRKSKSKCEPSASGGDRCRGCTAANADCTFSAPTFRRGPPKGYIKALERRLHEVESVLAAVMSSEDRRAMGIVSDLRKDDLARGILDRVDSGPFGPTGRLQRSVDPTQDNFFASIVGTDNQAAQPKITNSRTQRQSRASRENVIQQDPPTLARPTLKWQDGISRALANGFGSTSSGPGSVSSSSGRELSARVRSQSPTEPARQRRRLVTPVSQGSQADPDWNDVHATEEEHENLDDCADAFGNLSLDENREIRYHGNASGLHLLAQYDRTDGRNAGGIWKFPMAKYWPPAAPSTPNYDREVPKVDVPLPNSTIQDDLIELYFTYVNPVFPVIDRRAFMAQYRAQKTGARDIINSGNNKPSVHDVQPERMQKLSKLLLFSIFAIAARYSETPEIGGQYAANARTLLDSEYQESRTSTCQALCLLGIRGFGMGSLEEGWLHVGMALRMAIDLGLNRDAKNWKHDGEILFSTSENNIRIRIWWACYLADKYSALFLGRPIALHESDFSTPLPEVLADDADEVWQPLSCGVQATPLPAHPMSYFRQLASLSIIQGDVMEKIYPVCSVVSTPRRVLMEQIRSRLMQWYINLPEPLQCSSTCIHPCQPCPAPHVLVLHIKYWVIVLLLHRPFLGLSANNTSSNTTESFDLCQSAATHVASFVELFTKSYNPSWLPPYLPTYLQSAGIMHILTLKQKPSDRQATLGLRRCISALDGMQSTWPTAVRIADLLRYSKVQLDIAMSNPDKPHARQKRPLDEHAAQQQSSSEAIRIVPPLQPQVSIFVADGSLEPLEASFAPNSRPAMFDVSGISPATFIPGYEWWPPALYQDPAAPQLSTVQSQTPLQSQEFTFDHMHFSPAFVESIRDPILHFPSAFPGY